MDDKPLEKDLDLATSFYLELSALPLEDKIKELSEVFKYVSKDLEVKIRVSEVYLKIEKANED